MSISMKQSMALRQTLKMTPQLQQAIKLLQLSRLELETAVRKEMDENPMLEEGVEERETVAEAADSETAATASEQDPRKQDEFEWDSYFENQNKTRERSGSATEEIMNYENIIATKESLHDHLQWQASLYGFNEEELKLAQILIEHINDDGYIITPFAEIALQESVSEKDLEEIIPFIHEFDPPGVGARDLQECLLVQAKHLQEDTKDLVKLIKNHMKDLERKNYPNIAKEMGLQLEEVIDMCKIINTMDPKPGRQFSTNETLYVTPDVYVYKVADEYVVSLNEDGLPKLRISNFYKNMAQKKGNKDEAQNYIQDKLRSALWLIRSIHQRQRTIYKVTESIVKHQTEFFEKGSSFIKPMILRDIANDIGMHESTVSRVTTNKYVHTPQGIYELKYFFNSGISTDDGDSLASESVKMKIKALVSGEDHKRPLSDQKLVDLLKKDGIIIARRTVAKYRDVLKILPSSKRKKGF